MGAGKKQTVGHRYYVGLHLILCRQADALIEIKMAAKEAWRGSIASGRGFFNKPDLFGGDEREGGISGFFDFMNGNAAQAINDYLQGILGALTPAYRGAVSLVFRRPYLVANSARLPNMQFKLTNFAGIHKGWYPEKALINIEAFTNRTSLYLAWNVSEDIPTDEFEAGREFMRQVVSSVPFGPTRIYLQVFGVETSSSYEGSAFSDYSDLLQFIADVEQPVDSGSFGNWNAAFAFAPEFFAAAAGSAGTIFPTDYLASSLGTSFLNSITSESSQDAADNVMVVVGSFESAPLHIDPTLDLLATIPNLRTYCFVTNSGVVSDYEIIDNTDVDGVPVIDLDDPSADEFIRDGLVITFADMNPAHIIRNLWTDPMRGGVVAEAEIDDDNFRANADLFYAEGLGLSPRFSGGDAVEADRIDVERHADCISYRSRQNGLIRIKAVRNDYDPGDLPVLDSSIVLDWGNLERSQVAEVPNQLTVVYTKRANGDPASVTRTNIAGVRRSGRVIPGEQIEYPSCTVEELATRLCLRDLSVQNKPLLSGNLTLAYFPPELDIGEPFIINEPKLQIDNVIVRITEANEGDGVDNSVVVTVVEDKFALPAVGSTGPEPVPVVPEDAFAQPSPVRVVMEAPYYMLALDLTQEFVDDHLAAEPDLGVLIATGTKPTLAHRDMKIGIDDGSGYVDSGPSEFVAAVAILGALTGEADDDVVTVTPGPALDAINANSLAIIDGEIVRIDAFTQNGSNVDITIGRGCLDTVPAPHIAGSWLIFLQLAEPMEAPTFLASETAAVKLVTRLTSSSLSLFLAPEDTVTFASRAIRPYPPGAMQINGSYAWDQFVTDAVVTWAHRDRTIQTTPIPEDATASDIGPEAGTTYTLVAEAIDANRLPISTLDTAAMGTATSYDWDDATVLPDGTSRIRFTVTSERDGYESWQGATIELAVLFPPENLLVDLITGGFSFSWTDANSGDMQEDDVVIYRSTSPFDYSSLPSPLATLAADTVTYDDTTTTPATTYYYAVVMRRGTLVCGRFTDGIIAP